MSDNGNGADASSARSQVQCRQRWWLGTSMALLLFVSVLAHELAHTLVAQRRGIRVESITLFLFGGVSTLSQEARTARDEFQIAVAGPLTSFAIAALFLFLWLAARGSAVKWVEVAAGYLALLNATLGAFNLVPGFPLDGGRVLRAIVWERHHDLRGATRVASNAGHLVAALLIGVGAVAVVAGDVLDGLWFVLLGWFLWNATRSNYREFILQTAAQGLSITPFIKHDVLSVPPDLTLRQFADDYLLRHQCRAFFVATREDTVILGLITLADLQKTPGEEWSTVPVGRTMTPREHFVSVASDASVLTALQLIATHDINQVVARDGGRSSGLVTRGALLNAIQMREVVGA